METETTYAEQFANDWLLVAENDYDTYRSLLAGEGETMSEISDNLRQEWEQLAEQVIELVEENISPIAGMFISQILQGQGSRPFDIIARRVLEMKAEAFSPDDDVETVAWSSSNPTGERLSNV